MGIDGQASIPIGPTNGGGASSSSSSSSSSPHRRIVPRVAEHTHLRLERKLAADRAVASPRLARLTHRYVHENGTHWLLPHLIIQCHSCQSP
jgi:hypothetical protein